jgi:hypothetical protein
VDDGREVGRDEQDEAEERDEVWGEPVREARDDAFEVFGGGEREEDEEEEGGGENERVERRRRSRKKTKGKKNVEFGGRRSEKNFASLTVPERLVRVVEPRVPSGLVLVLLEPAQGARGEVAHFVSREGKKDKRQRGERIGDAASLVKRMCLPEKGFFSFSLSRDRQREFLAAFGRPVATPSEGSTREKKGGSREDTRKGKENRENVTRLKTVSGDV